MRKLFRTYLQRIIGSAAQTIYALPYFPGQWRIASLLLRISPRGKVILNDDNGFSYLVHPSNHVGHFLAIRRPCEPEIFALIEDKPDQIIIDVGANAGTFALPASNMAALLIAIDADPELCEMLLDTIQINNLHNIVVVHAAISNSDNETITFFRADNKRDLSSLSLTEILGRDSVTEIKVPNLKLETLIRKFGLERVDFLKIDAEGHSGTVIQSLGKFLNRVQTIVCEPSSDLPIESLGQVAPGFRPEQPLLHDLALAPHTRGTIVLRAKS